eukprot:1948912-Amphidinium_carterae.1
MIEVLRGIALRRERANLRISKHNLNQRIVEIFSSSSRGARNRSAVLVAWPFMPGTKKHV